MTTSAPLQITKLTHYELKDKAAIAVLHAEIVPDFTLLLHIWGGRLESDRALSDNC